MCAQRELELANGGDVVPYRLGRNRIAVQGGNASVCEGATVADLLAVGGGPFLVARGHYECVSVAAG